MPHRLLPIALAVTENAAAQTSQVAYILESAVRRSTKRFEFVDPVQKFDHVGVELRAAKQSKAADALIFGRRAYENLEDGLGRESFDRAIQFYEESAVWENFKGLSQAMVWRILVKWADDQLLTRKEIQRLIALDPKAEFPSEFTPPDLAQEVDRAREQRAAEPKFALDVNTTPVAARVYVDGAYRGTAPTSVRGLTQGEHHISLVAPGYAVVQQRARAQPGATLTVALEPAPRAKPFLTFLDRIKKGFGGADEVTAARVLGRVCESDEVMVAGVSRQASRLLITVHRIVMADGHVSAVGELDIAENDPQLPMAVNKLAEQVLSTDRPRGKEGEPLGIKSDLQNALDRLTSVSADKVKIGVGIAGGVLFLTGVTVGLVASSKEEDARGMKQTDPLAQDALSSGFGTAITGDILMLAGLVGAGTWGWLQFGRKFAKASDIGAPPVLDQKKEPEEKKKPPAEDDPFALRSPPDDESWGEATLEIFAAPAIESASFGVRGTF